MPSCPATALYNNARGTVLLLFLLIYLALHFIISSIRCASSMKPFTVYDTVLSLSYYHSIGPPLTIRQRLVTVLFTTRASYQVGDQYHSII